MGVTGEVAGWVTKVEQGDWVDGCPWLVSSVPLLATRYLREDIVLKENMMEYCGVMGCYRYTHIKDKYASLLYELDFTATHC